MRVDRVVDAWPFLPGYIKAAILTLAGGAVPGDNGAVVMVAEEVGGYIQASTVAQKYGLNDRVLRRALQQYRRSPSPAVLENTNRRNVTEPQFLYVEAALAPLIATLTRRRRPSNGPAKK